MIGDRRVVGIIPARGGSKGLPRKNVLDLCGKPLIAWTIEQAKSSGYLDVVMVSTDDPEIADISVHYGAAVPFIRPAALATDDASSYDVIRHVLSHYREVEGLEFEYTALLEPTSPLRERDDVDRMLEALDRRAHECDAIVSLGEVTAHPAIIKRLDGDRLAPFCPDLVQAKRRQDYAPAYFPFGVAYIAKTRTLLEENTFYTARCLGFPIKRYQNYEIDDVYDLICVESVMKREWGLE